MNINFHVTGQERKALVMAIGEITDWTVLYKGAPSFAYAVGDCVMDKAGTLTYSDTADREQLNSLLAALKERGYEGEPEAAEAAPDFHDLQMTEREELGLGTERREPLGEDGMQASDVPESEADSNTLDIVIPKEDFTDEALDNLRKLIASKHTLLKKALGIDGEDRLDFQIEDDQLHFPWFTLTGADGEADAYSRFVFALCEMAKTQTQVLATEKPVENDKFTMRIFLVRLDLKGPDNKAVRQLMLKNLTGNSSWKNGQPPKKTAVPEAPAAVEDAPAVEAEAPAGKTEDMAEVLADAELIHKLNTELEQQDTYKGEVVYYEKQ